MRHGRLDQEADAAEDRVQPDGFDQHGQDAHPIGSQNVGKDLVAHHDGLMGRDTADEHSPHKSLLFRFPRVADIGDVRRLAEAGCPGGFSAVGDDKHLDAVFPGLCDPVHQPLGGLPLGIGGKGVVQIGKDHLDAHLGQIRQLQGIDAVIHPFWYKFTQHMCCFSPARPSSVIKWEHNQI